MSNVERRTQDGSERKALQVTKLQKKKGHANEKMGIADCFYSRKRRIHC